MRIAGLPVWALVLVACAVSPFLIQLWIDAEQRRAKERTRSMLRPFLPAGAEGRGGDEIASGIGRAASIDRERIHPRSDDDHRDDD